MPSTFRSMLWSLKQARHITANTHAVLHQLAGFLGPRGLFPSHETLAAKAGCSVRTVIRALETAYALGIVERTKRMTWRGSRLVRCANAYTLHVMDMQAVKDAAEAATRKLKEALKRRKQRLQDLSDISAANSMNPLKYKRKTHSREEWLTILKGLDAGLTPEMAGYGVPPG